MAGQRLAAGFGRRIVRWIRRHAMPGGRALQQRLDRIAAEAQAADAQTATRKPRFSFDGSGRRLAHRVGIPVLTVAAVATLGIGGDVSAAPHSGPSLSPPLTQPSMGSQVLTDAVHAIRYSALEAADDTGHLAARHGSSRAAPWIGPVGRRSGARWPFRADGSRWPRVFANTTECTLSLDPMTRRHWWQ